MYALSWWTVSALTRVLFWCLFPELLHNLGNKHQNNPLVSAETVRHSSTCIVIYIYIYVWPSDATVIIGSSDGLWVVWCHDIAWIPWFIMNWTPRTNSHEIWKKYNGFHSIKCMWKCCLQNISHFVLVSICQLRFLWSLFLICIVGWGLTCLWSINYLTRVWIPQFWHRAVQNGLLSSMYWMVSYLGLD